MLTCSPDVNQRHTNTHGSNRTHHHAEGVARLKIYTRYIRTQRMTLENTTAHEHDEARPRKIESARQKHGEVALSDSRMEATNSTLKTATSAKVFGNDGGRRTADTKRQRIRSGSSTGIQPGSGSQRKDSLATMCCRQTRSTGQTRCSYSIRNPE